MRIPLFILLFYLVSCTQEKQSFVTGKTSINLSQVKTIYLKKNSETDSVRLTDLEMAAFVKRWNEAKEIGHYKYMLDFWVHLTLKDGSVRRFRNYQDLIKESSDLTFMMVDSTFLPAIWERNDQIK